jgi:hypothetical protein
MMMQRAASFQRKPVGLRFVARSIPTNGIGLSPRRRDRKAAGFMVASGHEVLGLIVDKNIWRGMISLIALNPVEKKSTARSQGKSA